MRFFLVLIALLISTVAFAGGNFAPRDFVTAKKELRQIYAHGGRTIYCNAEFSGNGQIQLPEGFTTPGMENRASRLEWEHVVPAENFGRHFVEWREGSFLCNGKKGRDCAKIASREFNLMESDMHNLYPAIGAVNALRSNYRYTQFSAMTPSTFGSCPMKIQNRMAEPPDYSKGVVARASLYMQEQYKDIVPEIFSEQQMKLFSVWNKMYPPTQEECVRNVKIGKIQGNENMFISEKCGQ